MTKPFAPMGAWSDVAQSHFGQSSDSRRGRRRFILQILPHRRGTLSDIQGKVITITGASSGIGEAAARLLAEHGAGIVLGARRTDRLEALVTASRGRVPRRPIGRSTSPGWIFRDGARLCRWLDARYRRSPRSGTERVGAGVCASGSVVRRDGDFQTPRAGGLVEILANTGELHMTFHRFTATRRALLALAVASTAALAAITSTPAHAAPPAV